MKKVAVLISGCGVFDGAEIHESVLALLALAKNNMAYTIFAPDKAQTQVIDHTNGKSMNETRNILVESARIARGQISALSNLTADQFDGLLIPGGFGVAKNFSNFASKGENMSVDHEIETIIKAFHHQNKPIAALCIAPIILAKTLGNIEVTIGNDDETAHAIEFFGAKHLNTDHTGIVVDRKNKIVTGPCYMMDSTILQIAENAENVVQAFHELM